MQPFSSGLSEICMSQATTISPALSLKSIDRVISFHKILQNILVFSIITWFDVFFDKIIQIRWANILFSIFIVVIRKSMMDLFPEDSALVKKIRQKTVIANYLDVRYIHKTNKSQ